MRSASRSLPALAAPLLLAAALLRPAPALGQPIPCFTEGGAAAPFDFELVARGPAGDAAVDRLKLQELLGAAECACDSRDLFARITVSTPHPGLAPLALWAGTGCPGSGAGCERITDTSLDAGSFAAAGVLDQRVPVLALASPIQHRCDADAGGALYFLFGASTTAPSCWLPLPYSAGAPAAPSIGVAADGFDAIVVSWTRPDPGGELPTGYQVLCADRDGRPLPGRGAAGLGDAFTGYPLGYSTCVDPASHRIQRRASLAAVAPTPSGAAGPAAVGTLAQLDQRFVCSELLAADALQARVTGLTPNTFYQVLVVAIGPSGNASPSRTVVVGTPHQVGFGGCGLGGGPASPGSPWAGLALLALVWLVRMNRLRRSSPARRRR